MELRPYQLDAIQKARVSIMNGNKRLIIQANCGAGKTIIAGSIIESALEKGKKVIFLVHFRQLAYQALQRFNDFGIGDEVGMIMAGEESHLNRPVQIISVQTYERRLKLDDLENNPWFKSADIVFYDECFVAGTIIDGRKIEDLRIGDYVNSYNEKEHIVEKKKITRIFKSKPKTLCKVILKNGKHLICTENHPFYSEKKYLTARNLSCNTIVHCIIESHEKENINEDNDWEVQYLWNRCRMFWEKTFQNIITSLSSWASLLFRRMPTGNETEASRRMRIAFSGNKQTICTGKNEKQQPYVKQENCGKNAVNQKSERHTKSLSVSAWWKRKAIANPPTNIGGGSGMGNGSVGRNKGTVHTKESESLQNRCGKSKITDRDRNRWGFSCWEKKRIGQEKGQMLKSIRVEGVEIYQQTSNGKFGGMCEDGFVYNIEVEDNNNYFAEGILVHNCHASIAKTRKAILNLYKDDAIIIGLTATPARADGRPLGEMYDDIVCCSNINELTSLGHLVPAIYYGATELPDLNNIPTVAGDYNQKVLGERVNKEKLVGDILENWLRIASDRQTVIFATNVKHSKYIQTVFSRNGINIEHIDSHTIEEDRQYILKRFKDGDVQVVTNVGVFCEGADFPWASCVVLAKPSKSFTRFIQMAGRGIRPYPGKENCILIDHAGLIQMHGFLDEDVFWSLDGKEKAWEKKKRDKKEKPPMTCEQCQHIFKGKECPKCGFEIPNYGKKIEVLEAELQEITRGKTKKKEYTMAEKLRFMQMAEYHRRLKNYDPGFSAHLFRSKFGVWPNRFKDVAPIEPDAGFRNYLKHRAIAYHNRNKKQEATGSEWKYLN